MAKLVKLHPDNPHDRVLKQVVEVLKKGGLIIYPTDTVYSLGCDINNLKALEKLAKIKKLKLKKTQFSIVCNDLSHLSNFVKQLDKSQYKLLKRALPGPFTFILETSKQLPLGYKGHKTIGIRVPDHSIPQHIVSLLGNPIVSTSIHDKDEIIEYTTDPEQMLENYKNIVDLVIDSGFGDNVASTVVDLTDNEPVILRQGKGILEDYL